MGKEEREKLMDLESVVYLGFVGVLLRGSVALMWDVGHLGKLVYALCQKRLFKDK